YSVNPATFVYVEKMAGIDNINAISLTPIQFHMIEGTQRRWSIF
ncbi:unnamed protein product, partial [Brassica oleracea]